jgi:hypothetical protein
MCGAKGGAGSMSEAVDTEAARRCNELFSGEERKGGQRAETEGEEKVEAVSESAGVGWGRKRGCGGVQGISGRRRVCSSSVASDL